MHLNVCLFLGALTMLIACSSQNASRNAPPAPPAAMSVGDTVKTLGNNIMTVYQDKNNNYWFASWQDGLYKYDGKTILHFSTKHGLPNNRVEEVQEDKQGHIYFNTSAGVCKFDGQQFSTLQAKENGEWKLQSGDLWFKSLQFDGVVYRYDGAELHRLQLPKNKPGEDWMAVHPGYSNPYAVYTIYKDHQHNIWFGTAGVGACRYNGVNFDWISEKDVTELHEGPANGVRSIIEDKEGYFWFNSAYRYQVYGQRPSPQHPFYNREKSIGNIDGNPNSDFWEYLSIAKDNDGALWIATYRNGVWRYDGEKTTHYPVQAGGKVITLFYIYKDNKGDLWLGTHENGVYKFNGMAFERFRP